MTNRQQLNRRDWMKGSVAAAALAMSHFPLSAFGFAGLEEGEDAERLAALLGFEPDRCEIVRLESANDLEETFRKVNAAINHLHERGIRPAEIAINFTSGTKMMGSGAVLSAVFNRCMELRYLTGAQAGARRRTVIKTHPTSR